VRYRLEKLRKSGIITTSKVFIDLAKVGKLFYKSHVYLQNTTEKRTNSLISFCESKAEITYVIRNIGPWELEVEFETSSFENFYQTMEEMKDRFPDVVKKHEYVVVTKDHQWDYYPDCHKPNSF
jgi:DNA-binding Lrp family transcriptional regulator